MKSPVTFKICAYVHTKCRLLLLFVTYLMTLTMIGLINNELERRRRRFSCYPDICLGGIVVILV